MDWIDKFFPIITLIIGWGLSQYGENWSVKKRDERKLKKLLFNLLELRWLIKKKLEVDNVIAELFEKLTDKLGNQFDGIANQETEKIQSQVIEQIKNAIAEDNVEVKKIESQIELIIPDLAEIYPVFAYEVNGGYKITDRTEKLDSYLSKFSELQDEVPKEVKSWFRLKLSEGFLTDLDKYIKKVASKINKKTKNKVFEKLSKSMRSTDQDADIFLEEYVDLVKNNLETNKP